MKNAPKTTIHVTGIPQSLDRADLKAMFSKFEGFVRICFHSDYIFVSFTEVAYAGKAIEIIHNTTDMLASYAKFGATPINSPSISVQPNPILYIRCSHMISIFPHFTEQELLKIFKSYEGFDSARFFSSHCLVRYRDVECAKRVLEDLNATTNLFANYSTKGTKKIQASNANSTLNGRHSAASSPSITASGTTNNNPLTMINNAAASGMYSLSSSYNSDSDAQSSTQSVNSNTLFDDDMHDKPNIDFQSNKFFERRGSYSSNASNNSSYYANSNHTGRSNSMSHNTSQPKRTLHVTNFNKTKNQLRSIFASFPGFKKVAFYQDYCFVIFSDAEAASNASEELLFKTKLKVSYAKADYVPYVVSASAIGTPNNVIRAADYPNSTTESELAEMFNSYPGFIDLKFSKNYSIVYFQDVNTAKVALEDMNRTTNFTLTYLKKSNNKYNNMNNSINSNSTNTSTTNNNSISINTNTASTITTPTSTSSINNPTNGISSPNGSINGMGLLNNNGSMNSLPNIHNFQNVPNYQNIKNGLKNQRNNISVFQRIPNINMNNKISPSSTTPSAILPSIATSLPLKGTKDTLPLSVNSSQLINGIDINNSPTAKINTMVFNDVAGNYNNAVMNQNNYIQNSTSQLIGVNAPGNTTNKVNEKSVLFTGGRYDDLMGQDQNSLFSLTLGSGKSSPIGSPISSPSYSPTISASGYLNNDSPVASIKSLSLNQPSYMSQAKSSYTTNFGSSIWSTGSTSSMSDIGSSNLPDYNPKMTGNTFNNIMSSSNTFNNELDLQSKAITPPMSASVVSERGVDKDINSISNGIIGSNRSIIENGRTTRSKSESFALQGIMNDINSAVNSVTSSEIGRKKSTASSIYDEIIGNDLMESYTKPLPLSAGSPTSIKSSTVNKLGITEENTESSPKGISEDTTSNLKSTEDIVKPKDFVNFFTNTLTTAADSLVSPSSSEIKKTEDESDNTKSEQTTDNQVSDNNTNTTTTADTTTANNNNNNTNHKNLTIKTDSYEKSQAYIELESQCQQFKTVVDSLISKLLSLQRENDILLNDKKELLQYKNQSQQEMEELKLENALLKDEIKLKNASIASNNNTNGSHSLKENIQNENSYMINSF